jgi:2-oxoisovalerate dehydrogenase E1 component alpha subunit
LTPPAILANLRVMGSESASTRRPQLIVPEPGYRHGHPLDFTDVHLSAPGEIGKPDLDVEAESIRAMAFGLIRVLDDEHRAVGPWAGSLTPKEMITGLDDMLRVRAFDAQMLRSQRQGKTSFYMQSLGEEAIACAHRRAQQPGDMNFATYRQQGLLLSTDYPLVTMIDQIYANTHDPMQGHQLPVLYSSKERGFFTVSGNLATQWIQAVGWAMASAITNDDKVASAWIGDGATAESDFHSGMVFASTYRPPVVLNIVNNQWAISTFQGVARGAAATFAAKGLGFGIPSLRADGNDYLAVHAVSRWALDRARQGLGPTLVEWVTYRVGAHSTSDDPTRYRSAEELEAWRRKDPILRFAAHLTRQGLLDESTEKSAMEAAREEVQRAVSACEAAPPVSPGSLVEDVYAEAPWHLREQREWIREQVKG